jgi:hypothetical protein
VSAPLAPRTPELLRPPGGQRPIDATAASIMVLLCALWGMGQVAIKIGNTGLSPPGWPGAGSRCARGAAWHRGGC